MKSIVIVVFQPFEKPQVESVVKNKNELCLCNTIWVDREGIPEWGIATFACVLVEVNKSDLDGIDTISYYVEASN